MSVCAWNVQHLGLGDVSGERAFLQLDLHALLREVARRAAPRGHAVCAAVPGDAVAVANGSTRADL